MVSFTSSWCVKEQECIAAYEPAIFLFLIAKLEKDKFGIYATGAMQKDYVNTGQTCSLLRLILVVRKHGFPMCPNQVKIPHCSSNRVGTSKIAAGRVNNYCYFFKDPLLSSMFEEWPFKTHPVIKPSGTQLWLVTLNFISTNNVWQWSLGSINDKQCNDTLYALVHSCYHHKPLRHILLILENIESLKIKRLKGKNSWCRKVCTIDH